VAATAPITVSVYLVLRLLQVTHKMVGWLVGV